MRLDSRRAMKPRERVMRALDHQEADRVPIDLGGTIVTGITRVANDNLRTYLGLKASDEPYIDICQGVVHPSEDLLQVFHVDVRRVSPRPPARTGPLFDEDGSFRSEWGIKFQRFGHYYDVVEYPLELATLECLDRFPWPDPQAPGRFAGLDDEVKGLYHGAEYAIIADMWIGGIMLHACRLRGFERFLSDLIVNPTFACALMDRILDLSKSFYERYLSIVGKYVQVIAVADDLGTQERMMISPSTYRALVKPRHKELYRFIKERTDAKLLMHSDGSILPIIPDLMEIGVDVLEPVQTSARDMDPAALKRDFGDQLAFYGGIDIQRVVSQGTPEEVEAEVKRILRIMKPGGGYVLSATHNLQPDTPPENAVALYSSAIQYGSYDV